MYMKNINNNVSQRGEALFSCMDKGRVLDIRYDPVFKAVFTKDTHESRTALSDLISVLIGKSVSVETIITNEPPIDDIRQRYLRFDVACVSDKGELINVEMSFNPIPSEPVRLEYHAARLFVGQGIHGKDKGYVDLKETYQITILSNSTFFPDKNLTHCFLYYDPKTGVPLGGKTRIITVELVKTKPIAEKPVEEMSNAELWSVFFNYLTDEEKRNKIKGIIDMEEGIAMAAGTLANITQDDIEYARMTTLIKSELDYRSGMAEYRDIGRSEGLVQGRNEGLAEGFANGLTEGLNKGRNEGFAEGMTEVARKMKNAGRSSDEIAEFTGLSIDYIGEL
jgi:predicted transposase/invertase (TIGR01784 family)